MSLAIIAARRRITRLWLPILLAAELRRSRLVICRMSNPELVHTRPSHSACVQVLPLRAAQREGQGWWIALGQKMDQQLCAVILVCDSWIDSDWRGYGMVPLARYLTNDISCIVWSKQQHRDQSRVILADCNLTSPTRGTGYRAHEYYKSVLELPLPLNSGEMENEGKVRYFNQGGTSRRIWGPNRIGLLARLGTGLPLAGLKQLAAPYYVLPTVYNIQPAPATPHNAPGCAQYLWLSHLRLKFRIAETS